jgi:hypothetical protein
MAMSILAGTLTFLCIGLYCIELGSNILHGTAWSPGLLSSV